MQRMKRIRAAVKGGFQRTTISVPAITMKQFERHLEANPGLTMSKFLTDCGVVFLERLEPR
jgi:hypothetical protein